MFYCLQFLVEEHIVERPYKYGTETTQSENNKDEVKVDSEDCTRNNREAGKQDTVEVGYEFVLAVEQEVSQLFDYSILSFIPIYHNFYLSFILNLIIKIH